MLKEMFIKVAIPAALLLASGCASTTQDSPPSGELEIARQFNETGQYRKAVASLQELRRRHPKSAIIESNLGFAYMGLNDFAAASLAYERALQYEPKNHNIRINYSYALIVQKRYSDARKNLEVIEIDGNFPYMEKVLVNMGLSYMEEKRCDLAHAKFDAAILLDPILTSAHFNNGRCFIMERKYPEAIKSFQLAIDACQGCIDPTLELASAYFKSGQSKIAREKLNAILANKPDPETESRIKKLLKENRF
jgi:tetratricopeptide (TPR) repeat protein